MHSLVRFTISRFPIENIGIARAGFLDWLPFVMPNSVKALNAKMYK